MDMVKKFYTLFLYCFLLGALVACRSTRNTRPAASVPPPPTHNPAMAPTISDETVNFSTEYSRRLGVPVPAMANQLLISTIADWIGVPYRYGGNDKNGVDCSGFINNVYPIVYSLQVPRIAAQMHARSQPVKTSELKEGDLVFFKINTPDVGHAGILLFDDYFVHATKSRGVMISRLQEAYWKKYFIGGGRYSR